ncbi:hypothetical protein ACWDTD_17085 [Gordonia sp. NPDC003425]
MLASVVFVPSAPLLVPELAGPAALDTVPVRTATLHAGDGLAAAASRWIAIGAADPSSVPTFGSSVPTFGSSVPTFGSSVPASGTFARFGVDVPVTLAARPRGDTDDGGRLPLSMLVAGWLRERSGARSVRPVIVDPDASPPACIALGERLAREVDDADEPIGVLVVADGATALSPTAPGGGRRETAVDLQQRIVDAIGTGDVSALGDLSTVECRTEGAAGRAAWQVSAGLVGDRAMDVRLLFADAPFGVGYVVASWQPVTTSAGAP